MSKLIDIEVSSLGRSDDLRRLVLFLPGLGGQPNQWSLVAPGLLASGIDVGHVAGVPNGRGSQNQRIFSMIETGRRLVDEVRELDYQYVHLVAHSVGSFVAFEAMHAVPELFASTLLVNGGLSTAGRFLERPVATLSRNLRGCVLTSYLIVLVGLPAPRTLRRLIARYRRLALLFLGPIVGSEALGSESVRHLLASNGGHPSLFVAVWCNRRAWSHFLEVAPTIESRIRFLAGGADGLADIRDTEEMVSLLPNASMTVLAGVGHAAPLEAPQAVLAEIAADIGGLEQLENEAPG